MRLYSMAPEYAFERHNQISPPIGAFLRMSGRFAAENRPAARAGRLARSWLAASVVTRRLLIALGLSLLAHIVLVFVPYWGGAGGEFSAGRSIGDAAGSRFRYQIHATLAPEPVAAAGKTPPAADEGSATQEAVAPASSPASGQGGLLPIAAPAYFTTDQLSKPPRLLHEADLDAENLRVLATSGKLVLRLWINDRGEVVETSTERSDLPPEFVQSVSAAFRRARFAPGEREGLAVGSIIRIEINYAEERRSAP